MQKVNPDLSNEKFLNTPENILVNIRKQQKIILEATKMIKGLKAELEAHKENGAIMSKFSSNGISATRTYKPSWIYSDALTEEINLLEQRKNAEQNDGVAKIGVKNYYWLVK